MYLFESPEVTSCGALRQERNIGRDFWINCLVALNLAHHATCKLLLAFLIYRIVLYIWIPCSFLSIDFGSRSLRSNEVTPTLCCFLFAIRLVNLYHFDLFFLFSFFFLDFLIRIVDVFMELFLLESCIQNPIFGKLGSHFSWRGVALI